MSCWLHIVNYLHCYTYTATTLTRYSPSAKKLIHLQSQTMICWGSFFDDKPMLGSLPAIGGLCSLWKLLNAHLSDDERANSDDVCPLFPEQNETLQPVHAAGEPQPAALVEGEVQGHGEEGGGQSISVSVSLRLHAVVGEVVVEILAEFVAQAWKRKKFVR
jgi:hypothetical protein